MRNRGIRKFVTQYGNSYDGEGAPDGMPLWHVVAIFLAELVACGLWFVALFMAEGIG